MSRLFLHPAYAEDQPLARTILTTHVLFRGFQSGAAVGLLLGSARHSLWLLRQRRSPSPIAQLQASTRLAFLPASIVRSTAVGAVVGTVLMAVALPGRMWGREEIEWKDRSWRLLENKGQQEVDTWGVVAAGVGALVGIGGGRGLVQRALWNGVVGGAGVGTTVGWVGYMVWRYGVHGGKWPDEGVPGMGS
ncbi:hypothetical protein MMC26_005401 [Xylographa opegraphella]|nr:hypothetical protein [Xylographa opegraphella]